MDKQELNGKTVEQLKRLAKKYGAKIETADGKKKNKTQLVNGVLMAYRLKGGKASGSKKQLSDGSRSYARRRRVGKYVVLMLPPGKKIYLVDWGGEKTGVEKILITRKTDENELKKEIKERGVTRAAVSSLIIK